MMVLDDEVQRLRSVGFLSVLNNEALKFIAFNSDVRGLHQSGTLFFEGEEAMGAFLILDGVLALYSHDHGTTREIARHEAGDIIDPYAMISRTQRNATATAVTELSFMTLDRLTFRRVLEAFPEAIEQLQDYIADDLSEMTVALNKVGARLDEIDQV